jgi:spore germination cell wall hydrolase CwlJ-like protein
MLEMGKLKMDSLEILSKTLFFEAGSTCDIFEVLYIGWVIRNRVEGPSWYGKTYEEVCLKKYQFSCWNGKTLDEIESIAWDNGSKNFRWSMCRFVAAYIIDAPADHNPIPKVYDYYNPQLCCPSWGRKYKRIYPHLKLKHIFFRRK